MKRYVCARASLCSLVQWIGAHRLFHSCMGLGWRSIVCTKNVQFAWACNREHSSHMATWAKNSPSLTIIGYLLSSSGPHLLYTCSLKLQSSFITVFSPSSKPAADGFYQTAGVETLVSSETLETHKHCTLHWLYKLNLCISKRVIWNKF